MLGAQPHVPVASLVPAGELVLSLVSLVFLVFKFHNNAEFFMSSTVHSQAGLTKVQECGHLVPIEHVHFYEQRAPSNMGREVGQFSGYQLLFLGYY